MGVISVLTEAGRWIYNHASPVIIAAITAVVTSLITQKLSPGYRDLVSRIAAANEQIAQLQKDLIQNESLRRKIEAFTLKKRITGDHQMGYRLTIDPSPVRIEKITIEYLGADGSRLGEQFIGEGHQTQPIHINIDRNVIRKQFNSNPDANKVGTITLRIVYELDGTQKTELLPIRYSYDPLPGTSGTFGFTISG
jgi:hypothetical protein